MGDMMFNDMYMNALIGLENGRLMPWDRNILASSPLPASVIEPYSSKEVTDVHESMKLTFEAMSAWIEEAKKINYFSKRFTKLSRMVMNGVTSMGRGLVTLYSRGEDPGQSPMSIQDLIGVASYHFRKSYLGVLQTVKTHPEISERLLFNQLNWCNMLMRLFRTKEKLEKPLLKTQTVLPAEDNPEDKTLEDGNIILPAAVSVNGRASDMNSCGFSAAGAFNEVGPFSPVRALSSYDKTRKTASVRKKPSAVRGKGSSLRTLPGQGSTEIGRPILENKELDLPEPEARDMFSDDLLKKEPVKETTEVTSTMCGKQKQTGPAETAGTSSGIINDESLKMKPAAENPEITGAPTEIIIKGFPLHIIGTEESLLHPKIEDIYSPPENKDSS